MPNRTFHEPLEAFMAEEAHGYCGLVCCAFRALVHSHQAAPLREALAKYPGRSYSQLLTLLRANDRLAVAPAIRLNKKGDAR
jgi:hypothetical protein